MKTLKATTLVIAALAAGFLLSSCNSQKKWVDKMQTTFPDDTFTYDGHPFAATGKDKSKILVKSELYTGQIVVCEEDGELKSNYLAYVYKDFCTAELERVLTGRFPCDKYVIGQSDQYLNTQLVYPVKNMNAKEFIATIIKLKPAAAKGTYVKSIYLSSTMSLGVKIDPKAVEEI